MKIKRIRLDVWNADVFVCWDCTPKEAAKSLEKRYKGIPKAVLEAMKEEADYRAACFHTVGEGCQVLWLSKKPHTSEGAGLLANEAVHAMAHLMRHWSIVTNYDTEEVLTSGVGYMVTETLKK